MPVARQVAAGILPTVGSGETELLRIEALEPGTYLLLGQVSLRLTTRTGAANLVVTILQNGRVIATAYGGVESDYAQQTSLSASGSLDVTGAEDATVRLVLRAGIRPSTAGAPEALLSPLSPVLQAIPVPAIQRSFVSAAPAGASTPAPAAPASTSEPAPAAAPSAPTPAPAAPASAFAPVPAASKVISRSPMQRLLEEEGAVYLPKVDPSQVVDIDPAFKDDDSKA